jgi:hypothetical protein
MGGLAAGILYKKIGLAILVNDGRSLLLKTMGHCMGPLGALKWHSSQY